MTRWICLGFGLGLLRPGPGTWGSAAAVVLGLLIDRFLGFPVLVLATLAVTALAWWALRAELSAAHEDPSEFVIDEVAGQWLALLFPAAAFWSRGVEDWAIHAYPGWVAAFVFFRLFDIWKPWLVGRADRAGGPAGVLGDDLWAGLFAGLATMVAAAVAHGVLM
ncbi:phosphatidylglycerophosphatase A family protein [Falsirhodobacter halotolerans]|uniref:phosphatidylglycerophosphatase A family protein n=1 Tax=Falsirhodobacter halotolerans TaxID=1146892 RepID=UPI001FD023FC|nr:phosphatidylglycerophosphatase A [Falsirhodobacter halotolerans]MCJ8139696.1 phosphatidylglycerophosphatase A [Falsirhodobacter halotolerans]